jgi:MgsA AAA+ ATPase C terminal
MDRSGEPKRYKSVQGLEEGCEGCERSTLCERCQPRNRGHTPLLIVYCTRQYPVPLHIRNAPTKLMKNLDYGKEYRYEPRFAHPVHQEFLPPELRTTRFVSPPLNVAGSSTIDTEEHQVRIDGPVLRPSDGQGPGACQRIFEIGSESGSCLRICHKYPAGSKKEGGGEGRWCSPPPFSRALQSNAECGQTTNAYSLGMSHHRPIRGYGFASRMGTDSQQ